MHKECPLPLMELCICWQSTVFILILEAVFCEHGITILKDPEPVIEDKTIHSYSEFNKCISTLFVLLTEHSHTLFHRYSKWSARCFVRVLFIMISRTPEHQACTAEGVGQAPHLLVLTQ